jgi:hypothetical protein
MLVQLEPIGTTMPRAANAVGVHTGPPKASVRLCAAGADPCRKRCSVRLLGWDRVGCRALQQLVEPGARAVLGDQDSLSSGEERFILTFRVSKVKRRGVDVAQVVKPGSRAAGQRLTRTVARVNGLSLRRREHVVVGFAAPLSADCQPLGDLAFTVIPEFLDRARFNAHRSRPPALGRALDALAADHSG